MKTTEDNDIRLKAMALVLKHLTSPGQNGSMLPPLPTLTWEVAGDEEEN